MSNGIKTRKGCSLFQSKGSSRSTESKYSKSQIFFCPPSIQPSSIPDAQTAIQSLILCSRICSCPPLIASIVTRSSPIIQAIERASESFSSFKYKSAWGSVSPVPSNSSFGSSNHSKNVVADLNRSFGPATWYSFETVFMRAFVGHLRRRTESVSVGETETVLGSLLRESETAR